MARHRNSHRGYRRSHKFESVVLVGLFGLLALGGLLYAAAIFWVQLLIGFGILASIAAASYGGFLFAQSRTSSETARRPVVEAAPVQPQVVIHHHHYPRKGDRGGQSRPNRTPQR
ncbi:hypothetical protein HGA91_02390 [candidate division WWE3 bacterium]|nr:hypothetical protein [candidate division WWE3 bacterium]